MVLKINDKLKNKRIMDSVFVYPYLIERDFDGNVLKVEMLTEKEVNCIPRIGEVISWVDGPKDENPEFFRVIEVIHEDEMPAGLDAWTVNIILERVKKNESNFLYDCLYRKWNK